MPGERRRAGGRGARCRERRRKLCGGRERVRVRCGRGTKSAAWWAASQLVGERRTGGGVRRAGQLACCKSFRPWRAGSNSLRRLKDLTTATRTPIEPPPPPAAPEPAPESTRAQHHVCAVPRSLHHEAPVAAALGPAARQVVRQRRWLQAARSEVPTPLPRALPPCTLGTGPIGLALSWSDALTLLVPQGR